MTTTEKMQALNALSLPDTVITAIDYENKGHFVRSDGHVFEDMPPFVRVQLTATPSPTSHIKMEVWLPEHWNGRFVGLGNGGLGDVIPYEDLVGRTRGGYAVAQTNLGTSDGWRRGVNNPDVWKDFGWRATYLMTTVGKQLTAAFYDKKEFRSYFQGGSTGGQQAFAMLQRYPAEYDGIIAGVPANNRTNLHTYFLWNHVHLRTRDGRRLFTPEQSKVVTDAAVVFYQRRGDGQTGDPYITAPRSTPDVIEEFLAFLSSEYGGYTDEQIDALRAIYNGPHDPVTGERIYNGMPMGSEVYGGGIQTHQQDHVGTLYPFVWVFGEDYDMYDFDFHDDLEKLNALLAPEVNANSVDLDAFFAHGGKFLFYSGNADPCVPFPDAVRYWQRLAERYEDIEQHCRYFVVPGQDHGASIHRHGPTTMNGHVVFTDILAVMQRWCEEGEGPDRFDYLPLPGATVTRPLLPTTVVPHAALDCPVCADRYLEQ